MKLNEFSRSGRDETKCIGDEEKMDRKGEVDLDDLKPVSLAEVAQRPNSSAGFTGLRAPELFERWWIKNGDKNWSVKHAAREGWYACAESLGVYDDQSEDHQ